MSNIDYQINNIVLFPYQFALQHFQAISEEAHWNGRVVVHLIWGLLEMSLPVINYIIAIFDALINQRPTAPWPSLPDVLLGEVSKFLTPKEVLRSIRVCKSWRDNIHRKEDVIWNQQAEIAGFTNGTTKIENIKHLFTQRHIFFGRQQWITYMGDPGEIPPLPSKICEILQSPCPFYHQHDGKTVGETQILVLIPKNITRIVDGTSVTAPLTLRTINEFIKSKNGTLFLSDRVLAEFGDTEIEKPYWVLITQGFRIPGTKNQSYDKQKEIVKNNYPAYQIPTVLEAITSLFLYHSRYRAPLFRNQYPGYTRCQEIVDGCPTQVGQLGRGLLEVYEENEAAEKIGVAGVLKLPSD